MLLKNKVLFTVIAVILGLLFLDIGVVVGTHFKWNAWGTLFFSLALLAIIALIYYVQLKRRMNYFLEECIQMKKSKKQIH